MILQLSSVTSGTVTATNTQQDLILIHDAGLTVALTVALPANPADGQLFVICSANGITSLSLTAVVGSILSTLTGMAAGGNGTWLYSKQNNKWYRVR